MAVARALFIAVIAVIAIACGRPAATAPPNAAAASASLPDWSGIWIPDIEDQFKQIDSNPLPWNPEVGDRVSVIVAPLRDGTHGGWCRGVTLLDSGKKLEC